MKYCIELIHSNATLMSNKKQCSALALIKFCYRVRLEAFKPGRVAVSSLSINAKVNIDDCSILTTTHANCQKPPELEKPTPP